MKPLPAFVMRNDDRPQLDVRMNERLDSVSHRIEGMENIEKVGAIGQFEIDADQPDVDEDIIQIDTTKGATVQLSIKEGNDLGFPPNSQVKLTLTKGTITNGETLVIPNDQLGTFRHAIDIAPSGNEGFGFLTVSLQTPQAEGCGSDKVYIGEFQVQEAAPAPAP